MDISEFRQALTPAALRVLKVLHVGLAGGIVVFTLVLLILYYAGGEVVSGESEEMLQFLSIAAFVIFVGAFWAGQLVFDKRFSREGLKMAGVPETSTHPHMSHGSSPAERCLSVLRTALLIRYALIEGATYFAIAVTTISITTGMIYLQQVYLINFAYPVVALIYFSLTIPTSERLEEMFLRRITGTGV
jgi:hypothetical protein